MNHDIVYILKNDIVSRELRYSLRSLKNFPHGKVWFFGGWPEGLHPDVQVTLLQKGCSKWEKVRNTLFTVCGTRELTDNFWLFNDDFYCMKPCDEIPPYYHGDLQGRIEEIRRAHHVSTSYRTQLQRTKDALEAAGFSTLNYAVHMPMLLNKEKTHEVITKFSDVPMFRSLYGNYWNVGGVDRSDVKIVRPDQEPDPDSDWLSTSDGSFRFGKVGEYIKAQFQEASEYER